MSEPERKDGASEESESPFRVIDRRRFAADGTERDPDAQSSEPAPAPKAPAASGPETGARAGAAPPAAPPEEPEPELGMPYGEPYGDEHSIPIEPTFSTLVMSLSTQALMCLGEIPEVVGQPPRRDLPAAKSVIDLLGVLQEKTRGNLDAGEAALFERILYDLRMRFVELSKT
jgi:hypothetical protein